MKLCICCCTYNRPHLLPRIIRCFMEQDYPLNDRYLLILDDGQQYGHTKQALPDNCAIITTAERFPSLGAKRNQAVRLAKGLGADAFLPIDDDDMFLPWHLPAAAAALQTSAWSRPSVVLTPFQMEGGGLAFRQNYTGRREDHRQERMYHPSWAIDIRLFEMAGGYPENQSGPEDKTLMHRMEALCPKTADPCDLPEPRQAIGYCPSYIYCWGNQNISGRLSRADPTGANAWESLRAECKPAILEPWKPDFDLHRPVIVPPVLPRPF